jgi:hypothetical protein
MLLEAMMRYLFPLLLLGVYGPVASAALIPYYRMDSLAFMSSDVVLCDEVKYDGDKVTFTVVEVFKGDCKPKQQLTVEVNTLYKRVRIGQKAGVDEVPLGRALLFLNKEKEKGTGGEVWRPVLGGVKLVVNGETYCYGQFRSNPGPLYLARMAPENIEVPEATAYGEELLLKDLRAALEKAKGLKKPDPRSSLEEVVRKDPKGK